MSYDDDDPKNVDHVPDKIKLIIFWWKIKIIIKNTKTFDYTSCLCTHNNIIIIIMYNVLHKYT